jgi:hypothetical protein
VATCTYSFPNNLNLGLKKINKYDKIISNPNLAATIIVNGEGCWWWYLMEHIHNDLMKLGGSLGNVPQKLKKTCYKNLTYFGLLVHFQDYNLHCINCTLEIGLTVRNI